MAGGQQAKNIRHSNPHPAYAWFAGHNGGIHSYSFQPVHEGKVTRFAESDECEFQDWRTSPTVTNFVMPPGYHTEFTVLRCFRWNCRKRITVYNVRPGVFDSAVSPHPALSLGERETRSPVREVVKNCGFTMRRQRCFPLPGGEGPRVRGKGANEYEGFSLSNSGLTDPPGPAFTHWKRRGIVFILNSSVRGTVERRRAYRRKALSCAAHDTGRSFPRPAARTAS